MRKLCLLLLMVCIACETPFDPNIPKGENVVVNAIFRPEAPFQVNLTTSNFITEPENLNPLSGGRVHVSTPEGLFEELTYSGNGNYVGQKVVGEERLFSLAVSVEGFTDLTSKDVIPDKVAVTKFEIEPNLRAVNLEDVGYPLTITFDDPPATSNYYALEVIVLNVAIGNDSGNIFDGDIGALFFEDTEVNIIQNVEIDIGDFSNIKAFPTLYFDDLRLKTEANVIEFFLSPENLVPEDFNDYEIYVVLKSISKSYFEYLRTTDFQLKVIEQGLPADPVQIDSNIENGLGIFGGYNFSILKATTVE